jgi:hypothetical protein
MTRRRIFGPAFLILRLGAGWRRKKHAWSQIFPPPVGPVSERHAREWMNLARATPNMENGSALPFEPFDAKQSQLRQSERSLKEPASLPECGLVCWSFGWFGLDQDRGTRCCDDLEQLFIAKVLYRDAHFGLCVVAILPFIRVGIFEGKDRKRPWRCRLRCCS